MKTHIIIVAGGSGTRFGGPVPKQFLLLDSRPVLMHTIEAFSTVSPDIVVALPEAHLRLWSELCDAHRFDVPHRVIVGGATRFASVKNALDALVADCADDLVAVHDGVRPLVSKSLIERTLEAAQRHGAAIPVVPVTDSIRQLDENGGNHAMARSVLRAIQTPQCFRLCELKQAYELPFDERITDDAMAYERLGRRVALVEGDTANMKITGPSDLAIAQLLLNHD